MKELEAFKLLKRVDYVVVNAGILRYPNVSFAKGLWRRIRWWYFLTMWL